MYFNKSIWNLLFIAYLKKKINIKNFFFLNKKTDTKIPPLFQKKVIKIKIKIISKKKKKFFFKRIREFFIHDGKLIIEKKIWSFKYNIKYYVKTKNLPKIIKKKGKK